MLWVLEKCVLLPVSREVFLFSWSSGFGNGEDGVLLLWGVVVLAAAVMCVCTCVCVFRKVLSSLREKTLRTGGPGKWPQARPPQGDSGLRHRPALQASL